MTAIERTASLLCERLLRPIDAASLALFRIGFGALMLVAVLRFFVHGWIDEYFVQPRHFFSYWGFGWIEPWPSPLMHLHFAAMGLCALGILLGYRYRASVVGFGLLFGYAHLIDKTHYLNHYYLVMCLCGLLAFLPLHHTWSLDARRRPELRQPLLPAWMLWALRAQLGLVYLFGGIAKLKPDWLISAQPLSIWLSRHTDMPLLGRVFAEPWTAHAMSWAGAAFDLSIVPLLLWRRTRPFAYLAVVAFHLLTAQLFQLGLFPYIMMFGSLLFLPPDWPRRAATMLGLAGPASAPRDLARPGGPPRLSLLLLAGYLTVQLLLPLRHLLYPGNVCWTEQGYRFSWNVMLMEKNGSVDFRVVDATTGRRYRVSPLEYFTAYQTKMMAPQPDMVLQAAQIVAADFRARGLTAPEVYADVFVSLNGRPMQRLVDPRADLAKVSDGLSNKPWILPMNTRPAGEALAWSRK